MSERWFTLGASGFASLCRSSSVNHTNRYHIRHVFPGQSPVDSGYIVKGGGGSRRLQLPPLSDPPRLKKGHFFSFSSAQFGKERMNIQHWVVGGVIHFEAVGVGGPLHPLESHPALCCHPYSSFAFCSGLQETPQNPLLHCGASGAQTLRLKPVSFRL